MCSTGLNALRAIVVHSCRSLIGLCQEVAINSDQRHRERHGGDANAESFRYVRVTMGPTAEHDKDATISLALADLDRALRPQRYRPLSSRDPNVNAKGGAIESFLTCSGYRSSAL
jgi:hypothetical protein